MNDRTPTQLQPTYQDLSQFKLPDGFRGKSAFTVQLWWLVDALLFQPSPQIAFAWRRMLLRLFGASIGRQVLLRPSVRVTYPWKLKIGDYSWIGDDVTIYSLGPITIGQHTVVSQGSYLCAGTHDPARVDFPILGPEIVIEDQVWLAAQVFVMPGITIGRGCVVAARSLVSSDLPAGQYCRGSPARVIAARRSSDS
jgi:putative colanic acid biosynthesis acetyltransferase WcaF